jgi:hypothetical protein
MIRFSGILLGGVCMFALLATFWPSTVLANGHAGCVRSLGGQPIANAAVSLLRVLPDGKSECLSRVWSQSDGSYQLDGALPEPVQDLRLEAAEQEHLTSQQLLSCGLQDFDLVPLATIDGQMSAFNGAAVPGARVQATDAENPQRMFETRSRWDGSFSLRVAPDCSYLVEGQSPGGSRSESCMAVLAGTLHCELRLMH